MGELFSFTCPNCGYEAAVSGGDDAGMKVVTATILCEDCRSLSDVVTAKVEDDFKELPLHCAKSDHHRVKPWNVGDPCPKCGGPMTNDGEVALWD